MKNFLLALLPNLTTKAAVTAAVCVTAGAAVTATATTVVYNHKAAEYEKEIESLEAAQSDDATGSSSGQKSAGQAPADAATAVRVVDGILEVWDGTQWTNYGSVDDIQSGDPYYDGGNDEKRQQLEQSIAAKKLDELGLKVNEEGQIVQKEEGEIPEGTVPTKKETVILVGNAGTTGGKTDNKNSAANRTDKTGNTNKNQTAVAAASSSPASTAGLTPEQVMAAIQGSGTIASMPMSASSTVTTSTWTASDSGGGGGGGPDPYSSDSDGGGGGDSSDSGGGGGGGGSSDSGSSSSDSGSSSSDSGSSNSEPSDSGGFNEGGSDDCGDDVK